MKSFLKNTAPILVLLNFIFSALLWFPVARYIYWEEMNGRRIVMIAIGILLISLVNIFVIWKGKRKYDKGFSISGYLVFVLLIPLVTPGIMACGGALIALLGKLPLWYPIV